MGKIDPPLERRPKTVLPKSLTNSFASSRKVWGSEGLPAAIVEPQPSPGLDGAESGKAAAWKTRPFSTVGSVTAKGSTFCYDPYIVMVY